MRNLFLATILTCFTFSALAAERPADQTKKGGSSGVGGGGYFITLPDQTVILGDPFIVREGVPFKLNPILEEELVAIGKLLVRYGANALKSDAAKSEFIDRYVTNSIVDYRYVSAPIENCEKGHLGSHPGTAGVGGCTTGNKTLIWGEKFLKMTLLEQAKTITHERLHASPFGSDEDYIADITDGIEVALKLYAAQSKNGGTKVSPNSKQFQQLSTMKMRIAQIGLRGDIYSLENQKWVDEYNVSPSGGGLVGPNVKMADDSFVGVGAEVRDSVLGSGAVIIGTKCPNCKLEQDSQVINSIIGPNGYAFSVYKGGKLINSRIEWRGSIGVDSTCINSIVNSLVMGNNSHVLHSYAYDLNMGNNSNFIESTLEISKDGKLYFGDNGLLRQNVELGDDSKVENVKLALDPNSKGLAIMRVASTTQIKNLKDEVRFKTAFWDSVVVGLKFKNTIPFDGKNTPVCQNGMIMTFKGVEDIENFSDLKKACRDHKD